MGGYGNGITYMSLIPANHLSVLATESIPLNFIFICLSILSGFYQVPFLWFGYFGKFFFLRYI